MESLLIEAAIILFLILLNAFFSGSEIAIISSKRSVIDRLAREGNENAKIVSRMKDEPEKFLATVQVGVTVAGTLASVIGGVAAIEFLKPLIAAVPIELISRSAGVIAAGIVVAVLSFALLLIGELVPKSLSLRYAEKIALATVRPLAFMARLSSFFVRILTASTRMVLRTMGIKDLDKQVFISHEELEFIIKEGRARGILEETEAQLLHGVFEFADTTVKEVMVPKHKFGALEINTPSDEVLKFISTTGYSRYPVYRERIENIVGILFNKDVFKTMEGCASVVLAELIRKPYFVPNSIMISKLLREMQRRRIHMAMVVDEHGDLDGLVTIEDVLEEIVGEIEDEYAKEGIIERLEDGSMIIDAAASLRDLETMGLHFGEEEHEEEYNSLAGFMLAKLQRIPLGGEFVLHNGHRFTVVDMEKNRIAKIKVETAQTNKLTGKDVE